MADGSTGTADGRMTPPAASPLLLLPNTYRAFFGGFAHLHRVQRDAIEPILDRRDVVLQSATGSGKTEAVLAPCMERVIRSQRAEAVLYVVPTRALAVDLERRFAPVLQQRLGLQFGIRTGDVKRAGGGRPDLLLTTPESFDVLLGSSNPDLQRFVQRIRMVVLDEIHPLLHQTRGKQLTFLLRRLERKTGASVQRIALSATIADVDAIVSFFGFRPDTVRLISTVQRDIVPHLVRLKREEELISLLDDLDETWGYRKILLFANSRGQCDRLFGLVSRKGRFQHSAELHYSNLKPRERRAVEERFRRRERALCIATSTLELGIDIGDVDGVILFEPPDSVSAFLQRIGRSNRRQSRTQFWGICRGERAGEQLLRFLALLRLARRGVVEAPLPNPFPSVLVQQVLSCLYEKKTISLPALKDLFPDCAGALDRIVPALEAQGWLRRERPALKPSALSRTTGRPARAPAFLRGGWRYRDAFLDRTIWSNFPETEEDYALEILGETVADLPRSIVRQLEPGDRVHLAGRRIRILQIDDARERKRVEAEPTEALDEKEILWLGTGFQVSFEVAQAMRDILALPEDAPDLTDSGLFARTRKLLREERGKRFVTLENGIEVLREPGGFYRYRTFLGSMGNLILRLTVERALRGEEDFYASSDEIGITCSHWIGFRDLPLPVDRESVHRWAAAHLRSLRFMLSLNVFAGALPEALLVEEITGFLYDSRVAEHFARTLTTSTEIVSGDPRALELPLGEAPGQAAVFLQPSASPPLLALEKERWARPEEPFTALQPGSAHIPRALTGTLVGEYMRHEQCERWLSFQFLPPHQRPGSGKRFGPEAEWEAVRTERGREHEARVLAWLREAGVSLFTLAERDREGVPRSLKDRFGETLERLNALTRELQPGESAILSQAVLLAPSLLSRSAEAAGAEPAAPQASGADPKARSASMPHPIDGLGIPDLIRVSRSPEGVLLEVGDIKDSPAPYYSQKWQVAFYALLLEECFQQQPAAADARVSDTGVLILRFDPVAARPLIHSFDLAPYRAASPVLLSNIRDVILSSSAEASCRLQKHCTTCPFFEFCYRQALWEEDIQFIPQLSEGTLLKLRRLGLKQIETALAWFQSAGAG